MSITDKLMKIAGKDDFHMDERISKGYIMQLCWKYGWMVLRGKRFQLGHPKIAKNIFVGKNVKALEKRYLSIREKTKLHDSVYIDALSTDGVKIGDHVVLGRNTRIECTGGLQHIGKGVSIWKQEYLWKVTAFLAAAGGIEIGKDVIAGQYIRFHSENHNYSDTSVLIKEQGVTHKGIKIGNNCWIGAGAVFLDGAELGDGCVVAANAVVSKKFPENSVIGGVPGKVIKKRGYKK